MTFFVDENIPQHVAKGFNILQSNEGLKLGIESKVVWLPDVFGRGALDVDWIPEVGKQKGIVITQDINLSRRKHELELLIKHQIRLFFIKGKSKKTGLSVWGMVLILAKNWSDIIKICQDSKEEAFAYEIMENRKPKRIVF